MIPNSDENRLNPFPETITLQSTVAIIDKLISYLKSYDASNCITEGGLSLIQFYRISKVGKGCSIFNV